MLLECCENINLVADLKLSDGLYNIGYIIFFYLSAGNRRNGFPDPGKQQPQVIVDFRHTTDRATWRPGNYFLFNRYRRAQTFNIIHIRLVHPVQELTGISAQAFRITPLTLRV